MRLPLCACIGVMVVTALPVRVLADDAPVTPNSLAAVQSILDRCSHLNPNAASRFEQYAARYLKSTPKPDVDKIRESPAYKGAYAKATASIAKQPEKEVASICSDLLAQPADLQAGEPKADGLNRDEPRPDEQKPKR